MDNLTTFVAPHGGVRPATAAWDQGTTNGIDRQPRDRDASAIQGATRNRPTASQWHGSMSRIGAAHERDGLVAPAVIAAEAARLRVSETAVRGHYREHARHVARKSGLVLGPLERHQIRHSQDFSDAGHELRALGIDAPAAAIEQAIRRAPGFELGDLKARERARRAVAA
jgi:hypothetical protein